MEGRQMGSPGSYWQQRVEEVNLGLVWHSQSTGDQPGVPQGSCALSTSRGPRRREYFSMKGSVPTGKQAAHAEQQKELTFSLALPSMTDLPTPSSFPWNRGAFQFQFRIFLSLLFLTARPCSLFYTTLKSILFLATTWKDRHPLGGLCTWPLLPTWVALGGHVRTPALATSPPSLAIHPVHMEQKLVLFFG